MGEEELIKFTAVVQKISTLQDGGLRITLDLSEDCIEQAAKLMEVRRVNAILEIVAVVIKINQNF